MSKKYGDDIYDGDPFRNAKDLIASIFGDTEGSTTKRNKKADHAPKKHKQVLLNFIEQHKAQNILDINESLSAVKNGVIEIINQNGSHHANGLLLTPDGFFVTKLLSVVTADNFFRENKYIKLSSGKIFPIEKVCAGSHKYALALAKAKIGREFFYENDYYCYRVSDTENPNSIKDNTGVVVLLSRWQNEIHLRSGRILSQDPGLKYRVNGHQLSPTILTSTVQILKEDSGGIVINQESEIIGIVVGRTGPNMDNAIISPMHHVLEIIRKYID